MLQGGSRHGSRVRLGPWNADFWDGLASLQRPSIWDIRIIFPRISSFFILCLFFAFLGFTLFPSTGQKQISHFLPGPDFSKLTVGPMGPKPQGPEIRPSRVARLSLLLGTLSAIEVESVNKKVGSKRCSDSMGQRSAGGHPLD